MICKYSMTTGESKPLVCKYAVTAAIGKSGTLKESSRNLKKAWGVEMATGIVPVHLVFREYLGRLGQSRVIPHVQSEVLD